jgi:hypothetical protein
LKKAPKIHWAGAGECDEKDAFSWYICTLNCSNFGLFLGVRVAKPLVDTRISDKKINWLIDYYDCPPSEPKNLSSFFKPLRKLSFYP